MTDRWDVVAGEITARLFPSALKAEMKARIANRLRRAYAKGLERAIKAVCARCAKGEPLSDVDECMSLGHIDYAGTCHPFSHDAKGNVTGHVVCPAAAIRREKPA